jgi:hypothetical protein
VPRSNGDIVASKKITAWAADSCDLSEIPGNGSLLTLGNACNQGIALSGSGTVTASGSIQVNAGASTPPGTACTSAMSLGGGGQSTITSTNGTITSVGGVSGNMTGYTPDPKTGVGAVVDPYWDPSNPLNPNNVLPPCFAGAATPGACQGNTINTVQGGNTGNGNQSTVQATSGTVLHPGIYYGGIRITGTGVTMQPGIYIMAGGGFSVGTGNTGVTGSGVVIYNTSDPGSTSPTAGSFDNTQGNSEVSLSAYAPNNTNDPWYGLTGFVVFQDRNLNPQPALFLQGGTTSARVLDGIVYAPGASITFQGNQDINLGGSLIVQQMSWNGSSDLNIANGGTPPPNNACSAATYQRLAWQDF